MKKKGVIVVIILLVVAAVLATVFVLLFKDKDTKSLAKDLDNAVATGYLSEESDEYKAIHAYLLKYQPMSGNNPEVTNYIEVMESFSNVANFFNKEAAFMEHTKTYSKNRKKIASALKSAQKNANNLVKTIEEKQAIIGGSERWEKVVWDNYKDYAQGMVLDTLRAFDLLSQVYSASVSSNFLNNDLTDVIFMGLRHLNAKVRENVKAENLGYNLHNFTNIYFNEALIERAVINYQYARESVKLDVQDIKENGEKTLRWQAFLAGGMQMV